MAKIYITNNNNSIFYEFRFFEKFNLLEVLQFLEIFQGKIISCVNVHNYAMYLPKNSKAPCQYLLKGLIGRFNFQFNVNTKTK